MVGKNPLVLPVIALASGVVASRLITFRTSAVLLAIAIAAALAFVVVRHLRRAAYIFALVSIGFSGVFVELLQRPGPSVSIDAGSRELVLLNGCVISPPVFYEGRDQFTVELAHHARARITLAIRDGESPPELAYGQRVELEARVRPVRNFQNPHAFDYRAYAAREHIYWTASVPAGGAIHLQPGRCGSPLLAAVFGLRTAALRRIEKLYAGSAYATGIMEATLIGESGKLERIWTDNFRRTGTYHLLVISGLHITVVAAFLLFLLRLCFVPEMAALLTAAVMSWLYALVCGWSPPVVRAAGGLTLYLAARYFYRRGQLLNLLSAVGFVYLIYDPAQLFDASFQLSFLSVAAIAALAVPLIESSSSIYARALGGITEEARDPRLPPRAAQFRLELRLLAETLHFYSRIPFGWVQRGLAILSRAVLFAYELALVSAVIQIALALPMTLYFHRISATGISANIFAVPLLSLVVPFGFVAIFSGWHVPATVAGWLLAGGEKVADWHARYEPSWRPADPPLWLSIAFSTALVLLACSLRRSRLWTAASTIAVCALFALIFWHPFPAQVHPGELELTAIDVGQGDSLLVSFPDSKLMLIDGGGVLSFGRRVKPRLEIGEDVVSPYLWSRSIQKLDIVALTHGHDDHAGGLPAIIENFHPTELWTGATPSSPAWSAILEKARARGTRIVPLHTGACFDVGGARVQVLSPPPDYLPSGSPKNNDSLALRISYRHRSFLLMGDLEKSMEYRLIASGDPLQADVLKVGHHGSNTSSTAPFLDRVAPKFALISDGFENSFGHPHSQVLGRLAHTHARVLRTDLDGLITVRTDGERISIETFAPRRESHEPYRTAAFSDF